MLLHTTTAVSSSQDPTLSAPCLTVDAAGAGPSSATAAAGRSQPGSSKTAAAAAGGGSGSSRKRPAAAQLLAAAAVEGNPSQIQLILPEKLLRNKVSAVVAVVRLWLSVGVVTASWGRCEVAMLSMCANSQQQPPVKNCDHAV
jgi:hypothetical protein